MAMIFDSFPSEIHAEGFAELVRKRHDLITRVFTDEGAAYADDPFPFALVTPIVHVERTDERTEAHIVKVAAACGGVFAGT